MKAVLFDLDDTILDRTQSLRDFVHWQAQGMLNSQITHKEAFVERFIELDANGAVWKDSVYETLIEEYSITGWTRQELLTSYVLCFSGFSKPKEGVLSAIATLKKMGLKLAVVTNGKSPFQERNLNALGVSAKFDAVIVSEAVGLRKPDKEIFQYRCNRIDVQPDETVFVGDNPIADIEGANNVGMYSIYVPGIHGKYCEQAAAVCENMANLPKIVENAS